MPEDKGRKLVAWAIRRHRTSFGAHDEPKGVALFFFGAYYPFMSSSGVVFLWDDRPGKNVEHIRPHKPIEIFPITGFPINRHGLDR